MMRQARCAVSFISDIVMYVLDIVSCDVLNGAPFCHVMAVM